MRQTVDVDEPGNGEAALAFDPWTLLRSLWRRKHWVLLGVALSACAALLISRRAATSTYEAETVLMYSPPPREDTAQEAQQPLALVTQMHLVKVSDHLEKVREVLRLPVSIRSLGRAIDASVQRGTNLLTIRTKWDSPKAAADVANAVRDVFLASGLARRRSSIRQEMQAMAARLAAVRDDLRRAEEALGDFTISNGVVDLDIEAKGYLEKVTSLDLLLDQARIEKKTIDLQAENLGRIISELDEKSRKERAAASQVEALSDVNLRIQRLRESIEDDKEYRANSALLERDAAEMEKADRLLAAGVISELEHRETAARYENQLALTVDTDQISAWRAQMKELDQVVIPSDRLTSSGRVAEEMTVRSFNIQLDRVALAEKVAYLEASREAAMDRLSSLPGLRRQHVILTREVSALEAERTKIEDLLSNARRCQESEATDFAVISEARPSPHPVKSNRKMIAGAIAAAGSVASLALVLALELLDTTLKSRRELAVKSRRPVLAVLPRRSENGVCLALPDSADRETYRDLARRVRDALPAKGARILVAAAARGEGTTSVAANLAAALAPRAGGTLLVDAGPPPRDGRSGALELVKSADGGIIGWTDLSAGRAADPAPAIHSTILPGVSCMPRGSAGRGSEMLDTGEMAGLLSECSASFGAVVVDGPPVLESGDGVALARDVDGVVLVVRSRQCRASDLRKALDRLEQDRVRVLGLVLNAVEPDYQEVG